MTAYIVEEEIKSGRLKVDEMAPISVEAWRTGGSKMFIREGTEVAVGDLLKGIIIQSGNDASVAIAEYIAEVRTLSRYDESAGSGTRLDEYKISQRNWFAK